MRITCAVGIVLLYLGSPLLAAEDTSAPPLTKNPTTAIAYSLLLPGLGQYYTEEYWKIPLFTGTCGVTAYLFFHYNAQFNDASELYDQLEAQGAPDNVLFNVRAQREVYRDNRDLSGVVFLATYVLAAIDAYVGAHLYDFDVSDDISLGLGPTPNSFAGLHLQLRW